MESKENHNIYGINRHGRRERPVEDAGIDGGDPNLAGGIENAEALEDIIGDGIVEANNAETVIDETTARTIARALTHALDDNSPALDAFARTGEGDRLAIEQEYFELYTNESTPDIVRNWINWLATYLFRRDFPETAPDLDLPYDAAVLPGMLILQSMNIGGNLTRFRRPADQTELSRAAMIARLETLLSEIGDPLRAYLGLPDVDASREDLVDRFRVDFAGEFKDLASAVDAVTEISGWERQLRAWAIDRGLEGMVAIDREKVEQLAREVWDIVTYGGRCYVFDK